MLPDHSWMPFSQSCTIRHSKHDLSRIGEFFLNELDELHEQAKLTAATWRKLTALRQFNWKTAHSDKGEAMLSP